jgi:hypothetical protein
MKQVSCCGSVQCQQCMTGRELLTAQDGMLSNWAVATEARAMMDVMAKVFMVTELSYVRWKGQLSECLYL